MVLLQDKRGKSRAILLAALFPFSAAICFQEPGDGFLTWLWTLTSGWECASCGVSKRPCNSNPLWVWLWAAGVPCEFRSYACTSFLCVRRGERQVFAGDFRRVSELHSAFQCWIAFTGSSVVPRGKGKYRGEKKSSTNVCAWEEREQVWVFLKILFQLSWKSIEL